MKTFDSSRKDLTPYGFTCERWTPQRMTRPDRHNEIELNLLQKGSVTYLLGGQKVTLQPKQLHVFWAAIPHQIIGYEDHAEYLVATLPLSWFLQCNLPERMVRHILQGHLLCDGQPCFELDWPAFERWVEDLEDGRSERVSVALLEIEARLMRFGLNLKHTSARNSAGIVSSDPNISVKAEQMAAYIAMHYTNPIRIDDIASTVKLHSNYAMNLFKKVFGATVNEFITQHRITHAQRLLISGNRKVLEVALASGFNSISRFNDAFKKMCGCSPLQYRRAHAISRS